MRSFILKGDFNEKQLYIEQFIKTNNITEYNVFRFDEIVKISETREIKKSLGLTSLHGQRRLYVISGNPTVEAQNSLLKTIEELDELTDFIFACEDELLPTIASRSTKVVLSIATGDAGSAPDHVKDIVYAPNIYSKLAVVEGLFLDKENNDYNKLILECRNILINKILKGDDGNCLELYKFLKNLTSQFALVGINNLNPKLVIEKLLLSLD